MAQKFYVGNYGGPLTVNVFANDGETPLLPQSATIDIYNMETGAQVVFGGTCLVASGLASYFIPSGSDATASAGHYVGYTSVMLETGNMQTEEVYYNVFEKTSYLIIERWRTKVQDSAPTDVHVDDDAAREWIDQAVAWVNRRMTTGYTSVLGAITPTPNGSDMEFFASVASLMARTAWWAGKGNWRDSEMSFNGTPFEEEWMKIQSVIEKVNADNWFADISFNGTMFNRDHVYYPGIKWDSPDYWERNSTDPEPIAEIPI